MQVRELGLKAKVAAYSLVFVVDVAEGRWRVGSQTRGSRKQDQMLRSKSKRDGGNSNPFPPNDEEVEVEKGIDSFPTSLVLEWSLYRCWQVLSNPRF